MIGLKSTTPNRKNTLSYSNEFMLHSTFGINLTIFGHRYLPSTSTPDVDSLTSVWLLSPHRTQNLLIFPFFWHILRLLFSISTYHCALSLYSASPCNVVSALFRCHNTHDTRVFSSLSVEGILPNLTSDAHRRCFESSIPKVLYKPAAYLPPAFHLRHY